MCEFVPTLPLFPRLSHFLNETRLDLIYEAPDSACVFSTPSKVLPVFGHQLRLLRWPDI